MLTYPRALPREPSASRARRVLSPPASFAPTRGARAAAAARARELARRPLLSCALLISTKAAAVAASAEALDVTSRRSRPMAVDTVKVSGAAAEVFTR